MTAPDMRDALTEAGNTLADVSNTLRVVEMALSLDDSRKMLQADECRALLHVVSVAHQQAKKGREDAFAVLG